MSRKNNFGQAGRGAFGTSHGAGKGDVDRSPGWRDHYDEVAWTEGDKRAEGNGFTRKGGKLVKRYGTADVIPHDRSANIKI